MQNFRFFLVIHKFIIYNILIGSIQLQFEFHDIDLHISENVKGEWYADY